MGDTATASATSASVAVEVNEDQEEPQQNLAQKTKKRSKNKRKGESSHAVMGAGAGGSAAEAVGLAAAAAGLGTGNKTVAANATLSSNGLNEHFQQLNISEASAAAATTTTATNNKKVNGETSHAHLHHNGHHHHQQSALMGAVAATNTNGNHVLATESKKPKNRSNKLRNKEAEQHCHTMESEQQPAGNTCDRTASAAAAAKMATTTDATDHDDTAIAEALPNGYVAHAKVEVNGENATALEDQKTAANANGAEQRSSVEAHNSHSPSETIMIAATALSSSTAKQTAATVTAIEMQQLKEALPAAADGATASSATDKSVANATLVTSLENTAPALDLSNVHIEYKEYESELQMHDIMRLIQAELSEPYSIYTYRYFIYNWPRLCFLAAHGNEYVGAIVCKLDMHMNVRRGYIAMLAVRKEYRKLRIGTTLVQKAIEAMLADNADEVVLETEMRNLPALRLYENLGFVRDKRLFRYYLNGVDALRLKLWFR